MKSTKPYCIAKRALWEAYRQAMANRRASGIDEETIAVFERDLSRNLYKAVEPDVVGLVFSAAGQASGNYESKG